MQLSQIIDSLPANIAEALLSQIDHAKISEATPDEIKKASELCVKNVIHLAEQLEISERLKVYQLLAQVPQAVVAIIVD